MSSRLGRMSLRITTTLQQHPSFLILAIITLGAVLRLIVLLQRPFNFDEALTFSFIRLPWREMMQRFFSSCDMMPPLYFVILKLLGGGVLWQFIPRFVSLLGGIGIMWASYRLGCLIFSPRVGVVTCLLISCSERFIFLSTEARSYGIWTTVSLFALYFFLLSSRHPRRLNWYACAGFLLLSVGLHYFGVFLLGLLLAISLIPHAVQRDFRRLLVGTGLVGLSGIGTVMLLKYRFYPYVFRVFSCDVNPARGLWELLLLYSNHWSIRFWFLGILAGALVLRRRNLLGPGWSLSGARRAFFALWGQPKQVVFLAWIIPLVVAVFAAILHRAYLSYPSYYLTAFVFFYLLVAWAHTVYPVELRRALMALTSIVLIVNALRFTGVYLNLPRSVETEARTIAQYLKERINRDDLVAVTDASETLNIFHYLDRPFRQVMSREQLSGELNSGWLCLALTEVLHDPQQLRPFQRLWLVCPLNKRISLPPGFMAHLELLQDHALPGVHIESYRIVK